MKFKELSFKFKIIFILINSICSQMYHEGNYLPPGVEHLVQSDHSETERPTTINYNRKTTRSNIRPDFLNTETKQLGRLGTEVVSTQPEQSIINEDPGYSTTKIGSSTESGLSSTTSPLLYLDARLKLPNLSKVVNGAGKLWSNPFTALPKKQEELKSKPEIRSKETGLDNKGLGVFIDISQITEKVQDYYSATESVSTNSEASWSSTTELSNSSTNSRLLNLEARVAQPDLSDVLNGAREALLNVFPGVAKKKLEEFRAKPKILNEEPGLNNKVQEVPNSQITKKLQDYSTTQSELYNLESTSIEPGLSSTKLVNLGQQTTPRPNEGSSLLKLDARLALPSISQVLNATGKLLSNALPDVIKKGPGLFKALPSPLFSTNFTLSNISQAINDAGTFFSNIIPQRFKKVEPLNTSIGASSTEASNKIPTVPIIETAWTVDLTRITSIDETSSIFLSTKQSIASSSTTTTPSSIALNPYPNPLPFLNNAIFFPTTAPKIEERMPTDQRPIDEKLIWLIKRAGIDEKSLLKIIREVLTTKKPAQLTTQVETSTEIREEPRLPNKGQESENSKINKNVQYNSTTESLFGNSETSWTKLIKKYQDKNEHNFVGMGKEIKPALKRAEILFPNILVPNPSTIIANTSSTIPNIKSTIMPYYDVTSPIKLYENLQKSKHDDFAEMRKEISEALEETRRESDKINQEYIEMRKEIEEALKEVRDSSDALSHLHFIHDLEHYQLSNNQDQQKNNLTRSKVEKILMDRIKYISNENKLGQNLDIVKTKSNLYK